MACVLSILTSNKNKPVFYKTGLCLTWLLSFRKVYAGIFCAASNPLRSASKLLGRRCLCRAGK